ncbi:MAG: hypothetical protein ABI905_00625 [Betaproteobacteria bacterium]
MNAITHKTWNARLYLDSVGSAAIITVTLAIVLLFVSISFEETRSTPQQAEQVCAPGQVRVADYSDQRPGAPRSAELANCA